IRAICIGDILKLSYPPFQNTLAKQERVRDKELWNAFGPGFERNRSGYLMDTGKSVPFQFLYYGSLAGSRSSGNYDSFLLHWLYHCSKFGTQSKELPVRLENKNKSYGFGV